MSSNLENREELAVTHSGSDIELNSGEAPASPDVHMSDRQRGFGIAGRLFLAFGAVTALTLLAGGTAWLSFQQINTAFNATADETVPAMAEAYKIKADAGAINAAAPQLFGATSAQERSELEFALSEELTILRKRLETLGELGAKPERLDTIAKELDAIDQAMNHLGDQVGLRLELEGQRATLVDQIDKTQAQAHEALAPLVEEAQQQMVAQTQFTTQTTSQSIQDLVENEVESLKADLQAQIVFAKMNTAVGEGLSAKQKRSIKKARDKVSELMVAFQQNLKGMSKETASLIKPQLFELLEIFEGEDALFAVQESLLKLTGSDRARAQVKLLKHKKRLKAVEAALGDILGNSLVVASAQVVNGSAAATELNDRGVTQLIDSGVGQVTSLLKLQANVNLMAGLLVQGAITDSLDSVSRLSALYQAAEQDTQNLLSSVAAGEKTDGLLSVFAALHEQGNGPSSAFALRKQELEVKTQAAEDLNVARVNVYLLNQQLDELNTLVESQLSSATTEVSGTIEESKLILLGIVVASVVIAVLIAWLYVGLNLVARLSRLSSSMGEIAAGDLSTEVPEGGSDEITDMGHALAIFRDNLSQADEERRENEAQREAASAQRRQDMLALADSFDASVKGVVESVSSSATQMQATAGNMSVTADETNQQAGVVSSAADETTGEVQTAAAAAQELSSSIDEIGRQVNHSNEIAGEASTRAQQTNAEIEGLAVAANKIGEVVNLIQEIAEQTNLLALNATIEAARAGDAGRGFAVVANEVKSLANQTAKATEEIGKQIGGMQTATGEAVSAIKTINQVIEQMNEISASISAAVEEQGAATQEIASTMQRVSEGTQSVSTNIGGVSRAAGETGQSANEVLAAADEVARQSETLRTQVDNFLQNVRAA